MPVPPQEIRVMQQPNAAMRAARELLLTRINLAILVIDSLRIAPHCGGAVGKLAGVPPKRRVTVCSRGVCAEEVPT